MVPEVLLLIKQICPTRAQVNDLWTTIPILFQPCTLKTIERIANPFASAHDAFVLVVAKGTFVADAHKGCRSHVRVADRALAVAFVAESAQRDAWLFAAHY